MRPARDGYLPIVDTAAETHAAPEGADDSAQRALLAKRRAAEAALEHVRGHTLIGVGHGSTVLAFIEALARSPHQVRAVVAATAVTARLLHERGIAVVPLADVVRLPVYVDGCDEADECLRLLKGAGGAHTLEKVTAMAAGLFVCMAEERKLVDHLGEGPVAVEVDRHAVAKASERLRSLGGDVVPRHGFETESGNPILDVYGLDVSADPLGLEHEIDALPGVLECGIFAARPADVLVLGSRSGVRTLRRSTEECPEGV